jgi:hypothetical protein
MGKRFNCIMTDSNKQGKVTYMINSTYTVLNIWTLYEGNIDFIYSF